MNTSISAMFSNALEQFQAAKEQFHKKRKIQRIAVEVPAFLEIDGKLFDVKTLDFSSNVIRFDRRFSLENKQPCVITFKTSPAIQLIGTPIISDQEFLAQGWNRMSLKMSIDWGKVFHAKK